MPGTLTISLDFELHWGVRDKKTIAQYQRNLLGARQAVPLLLELFRRYEVSATWAAVGFLLFDRRSDLLDHAPDIRPAYRDRSLSPYEDLWGIGESERDDPFHYARSLVRQILDTPRMELATHTFSHYYCLEEGQDPAALRADLQAAVITAAELGSTTTTIVFPRNQYDATALEVCRSLGLTAYRGNERSWLYEARDSAGDGWLRRAGRLLDAHLPITTPSLVAAQPSGAALVDVHATRLLRPAESPPRWASEVRRRRIASGMKHAAENDLGYHLWWHPHNFGADVQGNLRFLERILHHFRRLRDESGMQSLTMAQMAAAFRAA